jgi:hypothetical protein
MARYLSYYRLHFPSLCSIKTHNLPSNNYYHKNLRRFRSGSSVKIPRRLHISAHIPKHRHRRLALIVDFLFHFVHSTRRRFPVMDARVVVLILDLFFIRLQHLRSAFATRFVTLVFNV